MKRPNTSKYTIIQASEVARLLLPRKISRIRGMKKGWKRMACEFSYSKSALLILVALVAELKSLQTTTLAERGTSSHLISHSWHLKNLKTAKHGSLFQHTVSVLSSQNLSLPVTTQMLIISLCNGFCKQEVACPFMLHDLLRTDYIPYTYIGCWTYLAVFISPGRILFRLYKYVYYILTW